MAAAGIVDLELLSDDSKGRWGVRSPKRRKRRLDVQEGDEGSRMEQVASRTEEAGKQRKRLYFPQDNRMTIS